jgi:hypothetical protein
MYHYVDPVVSYPIKMGVMLLDKEIHGWYKDDGPSPINLGTLKLDSVKDCILGQLYGTFPVGMAALGISYHAAEHLGFMVPEQVNVVSYDRIYEAYTREWTDVITSRRNAGV